MDSYRLHEGILSDQFLVLKTDLSKIFTLEIRNYYMTENVI